MLALDDKRTMADWKIKVDEFRPWLSTNCVSVSHVNKSLDEFHVPFKTEILERTRDLCCFEPVWSSLWHKKSC